VVEQWEQGDGGAVTTAAKKVFIELIKDGRGNGDGGGGRGVGVGIS
jgi:hypothetical protein